MDARYAYAARHLFPGYFEASLALDYDEAEANETCNPVCINRPLPGNRPPSTKMTDAVALAGPPLQFGTPSIPRQAPFFDKFIAF